MAGAYQIPEYEELNRSIPCTERGPLDVVTHHEPATPCCIARDVIDEVKFYCKLYGKYITSANRCWSCTERKV